MTFPSRLPVALGCLALLALAGCNRTVNTVDTRLPPQPLPAAPVAAVESQPIAPVVEETTPETQVAAVEPPPPPPPAADAPPVTREAMAGTWKVGSDTSDCRIILAFTKWSGGYRAATRRCESADLTAVTAWDVRDNKVVLVDAGGTQVASLYASGQERYDGTTSGGKRISFNR